jgi:hypothetical protein
MEELEKVFGFVFVSIVVVVLVVAVLTTIGQHIVPIAAVVLIVGGAVYVLRNWSRWQHESNRARELEEKSRRRAAALNAIIVEEDGVTNLAKRVVASLRHA